MNANHPITVGHDVVAGARLRLRGRCQLVLVALRSDVVDLHLDAVTGAPLVAKRRKRVVGIGHPVVHGAEAQCSGGVAVSDKGRRHRGGRADRRRYQDTAASGAWTGAGRRAHGVTPCSPCLRPVLRGAAYAQGSKTARTTLLRGLCIEPHQLGLIVRPRNQRGLVMQADGTAKQF